MSEFQAPSKKTFIDVEDVLRRSLPAYESRKPQQTLAKAVEHAMESERTVLAEAGTGTGKSLGYLIPSILHATAGGGRVVISTATKALQGQIANKDLPFLAEHLNAPGVLPRPFSHALLKGRTNYVCMSKLNDPEYAATPQATACRAAVEEREDDEDFLGERDSLPEMTDSQWRELTVSGDECIGKSKCPFGKACLSEKAKTQAKAADVVVVNHALFITDMVIREATFGNISMLDEYSAVVFDEAHELEDYASNIVGGRISEFALRDLGARSNNMAHSHATDSLRGKMNLATQELSRAITALWGVLEPGRINLHTLDSNGTEFVDLVNAIGAITLILDDVEMSANINDAGRAALDRLRQTTQGLFEKTRDLTLGAFDEWVRWVEDERTHRGEVRRIIRTAPISVAPFFQKNLFGPDRVGTPILVSATMSVNGGFDYLKGRLGVGESDALDVGTPFDYQDQSRLYVPRHLPDPSRERNAWESMVLSEMRDLVKASSGRALLLFTSRRAMMSAYDALSPVIPYRSFMQGQMPNRQLSEEFQRDEESVLFATRSFMTGVDFQGSACSLVVIDKLPFPVPTDPLIQARSELVARRGGSSFGDYTVPSMTLVLKQGFGRLIRHRDDKGVVAILDPRLVTKGYGRNIIRSLPESPLMTQPSEVVAFFNKIDSDTP